MKGRILDQAQRGVGGRAVLSPGSAATRLLDLSAQNTHDPDQIVLTLAAVNQSTPPIGSNHILRSNIRWGTGRAAFAASLDFKKGGRFSLTASTLSVDVEYLGTSAPIVGPTVLVTAACSYGSASGGAGRQTFTAYTALLAATAVEEIVIPTFAARTTLYCNVAGQSGTVAILAAPGGTPRLIAPSSTLGVTQDIPNGGEIARVSNTGAVAATYALVFELALN